MAGVDAAESFISKVLNQGVKTAFNKDTLTAADNYLQKTFIPTMESHGIGSALFGVKSNGVRTGGLVSAFNSFANGKGIASDDAAALMARKIGAYGGAAVLGTGAASLAYSGITAGIKGGGEIAQSHPGAVALAAGAGVWATTAGSGIAKGLYGKARNLAAAGITKLGGLGKL